jgi:uncharacterized protein (DUF952 family)
MTEYIYKILTKEELIEFKNNEIFQGTELDKLDGFLHFSYKGKLKKIKKDQVKSTFELFFKKYHDNQEDLFVLKLNPEKFDLRVENSFPHLYDAKINYKTDIMEEVTMKVFLKD